MRALQRRSARTVAAALTAIALTAVTLTACSSGGSSTGEKTGTRTVVFLNPQPTNPYWQKMEAGLKAAAAKAGIKLSVLGSGADVGSQVNTMQSAVASHPAGIIVGALDSKGIVPGVVSANDAGIPVVAVDTEIDGGKVASLVQTDNVAAAALAGDYIGKNVKAGSTVLIVDGDPANQTAQARHKGVVQGLEEHGTFKMVTQTGMWDTNQAMNVVTNVLTSNPHLAAVFNASDQMTQGTLAALGDRTGIVVTGFDGDATVLKAVASGRVGADVAQDPCKIGSTGLQQMVNALDGKSVEKLVHVPAVMITSDNVKDFLDAGTGCS